MPHVSGQNNNNNDNNEEKARRRGAILGEIRGWNSTLSKVNSQISDLTTEQSKLNTYLTDWEAQKSNYDGNNILSDVVIINVFEGVCADKIKADLEICVKEMDRSHERVTELNDDVGSQIDRLNEYVSDINKILSDLHNELNSL